MEVDTGETGSVLLDRPFPCKSRLCVICVSEVAGPPSSNGGEGEGAGALDGEEGVTIPEIFLKGLSILCERLGLEGKYGEGELWEGLGEEDFVRLVCCMGCYKLLEGLVTLQELILATQKSMTKNVNKIEDCVVETAKRLEDVEFSVNSCYLFRRDVVANYVQKRRTQEMAKVGLKAGPRSSKRRKITNIVKEEKPTFKSCFVRLEKLESPEWPIRDANQSADEEVDTVESDFVSVFDHGDDDDADAYTPISLPEIPERIAKDDDDDHDEDFKPTTRWRRGGTKRKKPGRPKKKRTREELQKLLIKRKRGRPSKPRSLDEPNVRRPKGRPRKNLGSLSESADSNHVINTTGIQVAAVSSLSSDRTSNNLGEEYDPADKGEEEDEIAPSYAEEEYQPAIKRKTIRRKDRSLFKRPSGRPRKSLALMTIKQENQLNNDGPCPSYVKPVIVINSEDGVYSYHNVRIQRENNTLLCKDPGCSFNVGEMAYFSDQIAFRTMKMHIKDKHRIRKCTSTSDSQYRDYYSIDDSANLYSCSHCDNQFESRNALIDHVRASHSNAEPLSAFCEVCGATMPQSRLLRHFYSHKNPEERQMAEESKSVRRGKKKDVSTPLLFPCDQCDKVCKNQTLLRIHRISHVPVESRKQFQCDICGERLTTRNTLRYHRERVHFNAHQYPYVCHICNKKYNQCQKERYDVHMRLHTGETPFQCATCGKSFRCRYGLAKHDKTHLESKLPCEYCPNLYKNVKNLRNHQRKHHPDLVEHPNPGVNSKYTQAELRPDFIGPKMAHPCEPCGRVYVFKSQLVSHMRHKHKLFLPKSEDYPEQNTHEMQLERDVAKYRQDDPGTDYTKMAHRCEPCGKGYIFKCQLAAHMRHRHKLFLAKSADYPDQNTHEMQRLRDLKTDASESRNAHSFEDFVTSGSGSTYN